MKFSSSVIVAGFFSYFGQSFASRWKRLNAVALGMASSFIIRQKGGLFTDNLCLGKHCYNLTEIEDLLMRIISVPVHNGKTQTTLRRERR